MRTLSEESGNYEHLECRMITNKINILGVSEIKISGRGKKNYSELGNIYFVW
jgi:hypothetical protein